MADLPGSSGSYVLPSVRCVRRVRGLTGFTPLGLLVFYARRYGWVPRRPLPSILDRCLPVWSRPSRAVYIFQKCCQSSEKVVHLGGKRGRTFVAADV